MPGYPLIPRNFRAQRPARPAPAPPSAVQEMLARDFDEDRPFGVSHGEMLVPTPEPPAPQPTELVIEPPPWQAQLDAGDLDLDQLAPSTPPAEAMPALDALKLDAGDVSEPRPWAPPVTTNPAPPIRIPEPDWEAEQKARAQRDPEPAPEPPGESFFIAPPPWKAP